jgi:hypothetical protein
VVRGERAAYVGALVEKTIDHPLGQPRGSRLLPRHLSPRLRFFPVDALSAHAPFIENRKPRVRARAESAGLSRNAEWLAYIRRC